MFRSIRSAAALNRRKLKLNWRKLKLNDSSNNIIVFLSNSSSKTCTGIHTMGIHTRTSIGALTGTYTGACNNFRTCSRTRTIRVGSQFTVRCLSNKTTATSSITSDKAHLLQSQPQSKLQLQPQSQSQNQRHTRTKMDVRLLYRYLQLEQFSTTELHETFDKIYNASLSVQVAQQQHHHDQQQQPVSSLQDDLDKDNNNEINIQQQQPPIQIIHTEMETIPNKTSAPAMIHHGDVSNFLQIRMQEMEQDSKTNNFIKNIQQNPHTPALRVQYANDQATQLLNVFYKGYIPLNDGSTSNSSTSTLSTTPTLSLTKETFTLHLLELSASVDYKSTVPIAISMLLVGSSVGIVTPVMPFVVENLGLSPGQYGLVVSAFALAKMLGNVPSAILVEKHGRKPYLVYSLSFIALGVGGIGFASQFEHLYLCRLMTGLGVAALSTAATMTMSDISTPRNRASTMAPIMSAFAAGTALGPALGGLLADSVGISPTFYLVGVSYFGLTAVNHALLTETKTQPMVFPWHISKEKQCSADNDDVGDTTTTSQAIKEAVGQWAPLMSDYRVRNVVIMNGFYWFSLAGSQMTLLPLMLTNPEGLAMTATDVGKVYMGMSLVQVLGNPTLAKFVDKMGKAPAIFCGCTLISFAMATLPFCNDMNQMAGTLGVWALGSTMLSTAPVAYVTDTVSVEKRAQAIALLRTAGDVGFLVGATGTGALADWTGNLDVAMQSSAGLLLTATGWFATRQYIDLSSISSPSSSSSSDGGIHFAIAPKQKDQTSTSDRKNN